MTAELNISGVLDVSIVGVKLYLKDWHFPYQVTKHMPICLKSSWFRLTVNEIQEARSGV
jgi:hypothetical protein